MNAPLVPHAAPEGPPGLGPDHRTWPAPSASAHARPAAPPQPDAPVAAAAPVRPVDLVRLDGWSQALDVARRDDQTASRYVRLGSDGDQATLMLRQVPLGYFGHRLAEGGRFAGWERCPGARCAHCGRGSRASGRYLVDVLDVGAQARKLWEPSKTTLRALEAVARRFPPHLHVYEVTRHGRAGDQGTRYQILPAGEVTPELRTLADEAPLFDLEAESWGRSHDDGDRGTSAAVPF